MGISLAKYLLAVLLTKAGAGSSVYSFEPLSDCGTDPERPACALTRVCDTPGPLCAPPRWSKARHAWVRVESREHAAERMHRASLAATRAAVWLTRCKDHDQNVVEDCQPVNWPMGPRSLASAALTVSIWESGMREDIMSGYAPAGRGADGEACIMQVMPAFIAQHADWTPQRPAADMTTEDWAAEVLGDDVLSLERCYRVGMRMLARFRSHAQRKCRGATIHGMYAFYGNGGRDCAGKTTMLGEYAVKRVRTYDDIMRSWPNLIGIPEWAVASFGQIENYRDAKPRTVSPKYGDQPSRASDQPLQVVTNP